MKIEKTDLRDGGCEACDKVEYTYLPNDVVEKYPYEYVYRLRIGNTIHRLCEDCLKELIDISTEIINKNKML